MTYQTLLYEAKKIDEQFGWDYAENILFKSGELENPTDAMEAFNKFQIPDLPWIATMQRIENNEVIDEEMFDSSVIKEE